MTHGNPHYGATPGRLEYVGPGPNGGALYRDIDNPNSELIIHVPESAAVDFNNASTNSYEPTQMFVDPIQDIGRNMNPKLGVEPDRTQEWVRRPASNPTPASTATSPWRREPSALLQEEGTQSVRVTATPNTRTYTELALILQAAAEQMEHLHRVGMRTSDLQAARARTLLASLTDMGTQTNDRIRTVATMAVIDGHISRVQAANLIGVHQATVARWVKEERNKTAHDA